MTRPSVNDLLNSCQQRLNEPPGRGKITDDRLSDVARWRRTRQWSKLGDPTAQLLPWINLNPAGSESQVGNVLQPYKKSGTGWNMIVLSWRWGFDGCIAYNLFPIEGRNPKVLDDWVSSKNTELIDQAHAQIAGDLENVDAVITAWGANRHANRFADELLSRIRLACRHSSSLLSLWRIGQNAHGSPRHPGQGARHDWLPQCYATL